MTTRYGVSLPTYGGISLVHAELRRELRRRGVEALELRGSPYPEMARAEAVRQAVASDVEVLVFVAPTMDVPVDAIEKLVAEAEREKGLALVGSDDWTRALDFAAVHRDVLEAMIEAEKARYSNSAVSNVWSGKEVPSVPLASPWNRDGSSLVHGNYLTDSEAFLIRAGRVVGSRVSRITSLDAVDRRPKIQFREANVGAPVGADPGSAFALCMPTFGSLDRDQTVLVAELERAGMTVLQIHDCPWIDMARSWLAERALSLGKGVFFLDHDVLFDPNDVLRLCEQALGGGRQVGRQGEDLTDCRPAHPPACSVVAGAYCMRKGGKSIIGALDVPPGEVTWFEGGSTLPALYSGLGFAAIPRNVLEGIHLPKLWAHELNRSIRPWFALDCSTGFYAGEDVSFCNRVADLTVRQRGAEEWDMTHSGRPARVFIDTRVRLGHVGSYVYGIEDVGCVVPRYRKLVLTAVGSKKEAREMLVAVDQLPAEDRVAMLEGLDVLDEKKPEAKADFTL